MKSLWEKLYIVKKYQIKMLKTRGFVVPDENVLNMSFEEFRTQYQKRVTENNEIFSLLTTEITSPTNLLVWYVGTQGSDVPVSDIQTLLDFITDKEGRIKTFSHIMIISDQKLGTKAAEKLNNLSRLTIEHFLYYQLSYDPTNHILFPKHTRLTQKEAKMFFKQNSLYPTQLPTMYTSDPIAKIYHYKPGDVIFIERTAVIDLIPQTTIMYRLVVETPAS